MALGRFDVSVFYHWWALLPSACGSACRAAAQVAMLRPLCGSGACCMVKKGTV